MGLEQAGAGSRVAAQEMDVVLEEFAVAGEGFDLGLLGLHHPHQGREDPLPLTAVVGRRRKTAIAGPQASPFAVRAERGGQTGQKARQM